MQKYSRTIQCFKKKFRLQNNEMILSLQYCKLHRKENESMKDWMGRLYNPAEDNFKAHDRQLEENCKYCSAAHMQRQCPAFGKMCSMFGKQNHFQAVCGSSRGQVQMRLKPQKPRCMHKMHKEEEVPLSVPSQVENDKTSDSVSMETLTFHNIKSVICTRLGSSTSKIRTKIVYKVETGSDGILMLFSLENTVS